MCSGRCSSSATGFHGLHVTGGLVAFLLLLGRDVPGPDLHPRAGRQRGRRVLLLALRRRGVDCAVRRHLHPAIGREPRVVCIRLPGSWTTEYMFGPHHASRTREGPECDSCLPAPTPGSQGVAAGVRALRDGCALQRDRAASPRCRPTPETASRSPRVRHYSRSAARPVTG